jgi:hypothetical protein
VFREEAFDRWCIDAFGGSWSIYSISAVESLSQTLKLGDPLSMELTNIRDQQRDVFCGVISEREQRYFTGAAARVAVPSFESMRAVALWRLRRFDALFDLQQLFCSQHRKALYQSRNRTASP